MSTGPATDARYRVLMVPRQSGQRVAAKGVASLLGYLQFTSLVVAGDPVADDDWEHIPLAPAAASHHLFVEGDAPAEPAFLDGVLAWGATPRPLPWGQGTACFWLALEGCLWPHPDESLRERIHQVLALRTDARSQEA